MGFAKNASRNLPDFWFGALIVLAFMLKLSTVSAQTKRPAFGQSEEDLKRPTRFEMELDVRDAGVDCSFTKDSSAALNSIVARPDSDGHAITFPPGCHVKLEHTWLVKHLSGFTIRGTSGAGHNGIYAT